MESVNISGRENCDFVSRLPDLILHDILGLLNTKEAVQTCVLSKRWEHLWTSLSSLSFEWNEQHAFLNGTAESARFGKFVDNFLLRRKPLDLDMFHLSCFKFRSTYPWQVRDWIRYAVNHNTRVLHITYDCSVPCCIYTCTSLEELYLGFPCIGSSVPVINLPKLRKLTIHYEHLNSGNVKNLLSGCPTLEFLRLDSCFFSECTIISHECLKHLSIVNCYRDGTSLFINAPNLLSFSYDGKLSKTTLNMPSLTFACLESCNSLTNTSSDGLVTFFSSLTNAEFLELHLECSLHQELPTVVLPLQLPIFQKLEDVTVTFRMLSGFQMVTWILKSSPNLTKLTIVQQEKCWIHEKEEDSANVPTNTSLMIAISSCKKLELVEVKYWKYNKTVQQLIDTVRGGTKEFKNVKMNTSKYKISTQYLKKKQQLSF